MYMVQSHNFTVNEPHLPYSPTFCKPGVGRVGVEVALSVQLSMTNPTRQIGRYIVSYACIYPNRLCLLASAFGDTLEVGCMDGRSVDGTACVPSLRKVVAA